MPPEILSQKLIDFVQKKGMIRARELDALGIPRVYLSRLVRGGQLERVSRGLYQLVDSDITAHFTLVQAAREQLALDTEFRSIDRTELYTADEVFVCGTGAQVAPVTTIDRRPIGDGKPGPITDKLQKLYFDIVRGDHEYYPAWRTPVYV